MELELENTEDHIGEIIIIKKDGNDGATFPLLKTDDSWLFGSGENCQIRLKKLGVADIHCRIEVVRADDSQDEDYKFRLVTLAGTYLNGTALANTPTKNSKTKTLKHGDIITIPNLQGRQFRIEYPAGHKMRRRSARSSMSAKSIRSNTVPKVATPKGVGSIKKTGLPTPMSQQKRRVTFGKQLTPEIFDYRRPPKTPISRGATPRGHEKSARRSIIKATPLKYVREESFQEPVIKLNFNDFEASPSPEKKPSPKIERVDVEKPQTPETPAEKRKSRRRSSFFRKIEEVQEEQKVPERSETPQPKTPEPKTPEKRTSLLPKPLDAPETPSTPPRVRTLGSIRKQVRAQNPRTPDTPGRRRSLIVNKLTKVPSYRAKLKRLSMDPKALEDSIRRWGRMAVNLEFDVEVFRQYEAGVKNEEQTVKNKEKLDSLYVDRESTEPVENKENEDKENTAPVEPGKAKTPLKDLPLPKSPLVSSPRVLTVHRAEVENSPVKSVGVTPGQTAMKTLFSEEPKKSEPITPGNAAMKIFREEKVHETTTPDQSAMKNIFKEGTPRRRSSRIAKASIPVTPGNMAMKIFREEKPVEAVTPDQLAMKNIFKEQKASVPVTPGNAAMKIFREEKIHLAKTPDQSAMKTIFKEAKASEPVTPGNMAMKIFREEKPVEAATPDQLAMKKIFKEQKLSVPVTPGNAAMKIFKEEKETGPMTPDQAAMKELFNKAPEHQMATPAGGLLKKLYEEPKPGPNTPDQTAVKRIFQENDAAHQSKTPKLGDVRTLFVEEKDYGMSPECKAMRGVFEGGHHKGDQEKSVPDATVTPGSKAMRNFFEKDEVDAKKDFDARSTSEPVTPGQKAMRNMFEEDENPSTPQKHDSTKEEGYLEKIFLESQTGSSKISTPVKELFSTPAREAKFSDFCDSALKKKDETRMKIENMISPGPTAMKQTFKEEESLESPKLEGTVMRACFQEDSVIDFENEEDMNAVEDLIENIFAEDYALAGLFAEKRQELNVQSPEALVMKALFEGDPIELEIDEEVSISTEPIKKYLQLDREVRSSARKRPPPVKVRVGGRKTRSMSREDFNIDTILNPVSLKRDKPEADSMKPEVDEKEPEKPEVRKTRKGRSAKTEQIEVENPLPKPKTVRGKAKKAIESAVTEQELQSEVVESQPEPKSAGRRTRNKKEEKVESTSEPEAESVLEAVSDAEPVKKSGRRKKVAESIPEKPIPVEPIQEKELKKPARRGARKKKEEIEEKEISPEPVTVSKPADSEIVEPKKKPVKRGKKKSSESQDESEKEEHTSPKKARKTAKKGAHVVKSTRSTRSATEAVRPPPEVIMEKVETKSALRSDEVAKVTKTVSFRNRRSEIPGHEVKTDESLEGKTTKKSTRSRKTSGTDKSTTKGAKKLVSVAEAEPEKALLPESSPEQDSGKPRKSDRKKKVPEKEPEAAVEPEAEPEASPKKPVRRAPKAKTEEPKPARRTRKVSGQQSGPPAVKTNMRRTRRNSGTDSEAVTSELPPSPSLPKKSKKAEKVENPEKVEKPVRATRRTKKAEIDQTPPKEDEKKPVRGRKTKKESPEPSEEKPARKTRSRK